MTPSRDIGRLLELMKTLRTPDTGCPWDLAQTFATIAPYTVEEAYEVADAIARNHLPDLRDELGDLLLQVVFHARMAEEQHAFDFGSVVEAISAKLIRRHPHVFSDPRAGLAPDDVKQSWDAIKAAERQAGTPDAGRPPGALDGVALNLPALSRADKLSRKAAASGFDWDDAGAVIAKVAEELDEVRDAALVGEHPHIAEEIGDLLFAVVNLARKLKIDPEASLADANRKFERRFRHMEATLSATGGILSTISGPRMNELWDAAKASERERGEER